MPETNIGLIIDTIETPAAGTEKQVVALAAGLRQSRQVNPFLCCLRLSPWLKENFSACPVFSIEVDKLFCLKAIKQVHALAKFFRAQNIQLVHTFFRDASLVGITAARLAGVPVVIAARRNKGYWHNRREILLLKIMNRFVDGFLANSYDVKEFTHRREGVALDKIEVIYNGFDFADYPAGAVVQKTALRNGLGIPAAAIVGVAVANLRPVKGLDILLQALPDVLSVHPQFYLLIIGEGAQRPRLEQLIEELRLADRVKLLGRRLDVMSILAACDLGILPSLSEGLPNAVIEYMAAGLPVVATDVGGLREMVFPRNGLVPPGEIAPLSRAITAVLHDPGAMKNQGQRSQKTARQMFALQNCIDQHEVYYLRRLAAKKHL